MDTDLELVRRGYDPAQVQELVGTLSSELKALTAENDRIRAQLSELQQATPPTAPTPDPDVFEHWAAETNSLLAAARVSIAAVHAQAVIDAAAAVAAAEAEAVEVRHQAQLDAELALGEANRQALETIAAADAHRLTTETEMQALADRTTAQVTDAKAQLADLVQQRAAISRQLGSTRAQLTQLLSLVAPPDDEPATDEPASDQQIASAEHADDHA